MCGAERASLTTTKVEGAELDLCDECTSFGTAVRTDDAGSGTETKYSTGSASGGGSTGGGATAGTGGTGSSGGGSSQRDMFDEMDHVATDYDRRIREAREGAGLSQAELSDQLNVKASLIRKLERGEMLPSDEIQSKLERALDISLVEGGEPDDTEWSSGAEGGTTLGDIVQRKE